MGVSVTDPLGEAQTRTGRMLFKPFNAGKWFTLGFAAWLAQLLEGAGGSIQFPDFGGGGGGGGGAGGGGPAGTVNSGTSWFYATLHEVKQLFLPHAYWIIPVVLILLAIVIALLWIRSRGKFIFLENVALDRVAIVEPWKRLRPLANNFLRFELRLILVMLFALLVTAVGCYLIAEPDLATNQLTSAGITAMVIAGLVILAVSLLYALIKTVAEDFLIPLMYLRAQPIGPAWTEFRTRLLPGNIGSFILFYLMRIVLGIATGMIMLIGMCLTCCLAALPYISTVFFLPIFVFIRCYSLYFLRQFGPEYNLLADVEPVPLMAFPVIVNQPPPLPPMNQSNQAGDQY